VGSLLCEAGESLKAYSVSGHRHLPEVEERLTVAAGGPVSLTFVPHLIPMIRGIHATLYGRISPGHRKSFVLEQLQENYLFRYASHPFVDVMPLGSYPETRSVKGSNICRISLHQPQGGDMVVVLSAIDNLVKGAAGQAIQNMNLMLGFAEQMGLEQVPLTP
jgi:N-acetyl-gamma-glutamyl-phosphate reductase